MVDQEDLDGGASTILANREIIPLNQIKVMCGAQRDPINFISSFASSTVGMLTIAGAIALDPKQAVISAGRVIQGGIKLSFVKSVGDELKRLAKENKIDLKFANSSYFIQNFGELLRALEYDDISPEKLEFIKKVFLAGLMGAAEKNMLLANRLLHIASVMGVDEILLLKVIYQKESVIGGVKEFVGTALIELLATISGIPFEDDCKQALHSLSGRGLTGRIDERILDTQNLIIFNPEFRSSKGEELYNFLIFYEAKK